MLEEYKNNQILVHFISSQFAETKKAGARETYRWLIRCHATISDTYIYVRAYDARSYTVILFLIEQSNRLRTIQREMTHLFNIFSRCLFLIFFLHSW